MILVKPNGGLGNRMRVINSAMCLANRNNQSLIKVLWKKDWGLNARFCEIFEHVDKLDVIENKFLMAWYFYSRKKLPLSYKYYDDQTILEKRYDEAYWNHDHRNVILNTCFDFYNPIQANNFFGIFRPVSKIQKKIDQVTKDFTTDWVGVHIRRTDHLLAKENSETSAFIYKMDYLLELKPNTKFYLATDDPATELQLKEQYGDKIFTLKNKITNRGEVNGIEDAVTDMFCLSKTQLILGSCSSSFSEVAAAIGKIPLETISKKISTEGQAK